MAVTTRLGSLALINDTMRDVAVSQVRLSELQNQISSGYKSRDFEGLNGSVEQFTHVNNQLSRGTQFRTNNQVNIAKLQTADAALAKITEIVDTMKNNIVGATGATISSSNLPQILRDLLISMGGELNATFNGHYIFGGTDTKNPPVLDTRANSVTPGFPTDAYYSGSKDDYIMRIDERTDVTFPARADDVAFQKVYAAVNQAIQAAEAGDTLTMQKAQQLIQEGQRDLISVRSRVGSTVVNIEAIDSRIAELTTYWKELSDKVSKTDIVAASAEVAGYQAILQASYQVYARLSQLRLSDYL